MGLRGKRKPPSKGYRQIEMSIPWMGSRKLPSDATHTDLGEKNVDPMLELNPAKKKTSHRMAENCQVVKGHFSALANVRLFLCKWPKENTSQASDANKSLVIPAKVEAVCYMLLARSDKAIVAVIRRFLLPSNFPRA